MKENIREELLLDDESIFPPNNSEWRRPQGTYIRDFDALIRLKNFYRKSLVVSEYITYFLTILVLVVLVKLVFFTTYEVTVLDDGSQLFCTIEDDGSIAIAY